MNAPLILARTFKDAHTFAEEKLGLRIGHYRVVNSAGTIKACRDVNLYLVPGWDKRPDRFTMGSAIKWCRLNIVDAAEMADVEPQAPEPASEPAVDDFFTPPDSNTLESLLKPGAKGPHGNATTLSLGEALALQESVPTVVGPEVVALDEAAKPKNRRRRKCATCEQMHYKGDPCIESEA